MRCDSPVSTLAGFVPAVVLVLACPASAVAQLTQVELQTGVERLRYSYRFQNDSSFDTPHLVPHEFEQKYDRTTPTAELRISYGAWSRMWATRLGATPPGLAFGSDIDTFYQPTGDVVTSGTSGDVRLWSWWVEQELFDRSARSLVPTLVAGIRRDRAEYLPADRVVTHSQPPSESREWTTDRETTVSHTIHFGLRGGRRWTTHGGGRYVDLRVDALPAVIGRLSTRLPDKYPGRDIVFVAAGWTIGAEVSVGLRVGAVHLVAYARGARTGAYLNRARMSRSPVAAGLRVVR